MTPEQFDTLCDLIRANTKAMEAIASRPAPSTPASAPASASGVCFPNYGRSKGQPVAGASRGDLMFYASGCRRTLGDPGKARFHDKERALLAAIESELARQGVEPPHDPGTGEVAPDFGSDDSIPF